MRRAALAALLWLLATPVAAAPARVSSGEHGDFTRLVVYAGTAAQSGGEDWALGRTEGGYELRITGLEDGFDTGGAFVRLTRARLADLVPGEAPGALRMVLNCACHIVPFVVEPGILALDIRDGPAPEGSPYEATLDTPEPAAPPDPATDPAGAASLAAAAPSDNPLSRVWLVEALGQSPAPLPAPEQATELPGAAAPAAGPAPAPGPAAEAPADTAPGPEGGGAALAALPDPALEPLREALVREISLGAARGVVGMALPEATGAPGRPGTPPDQARIGHGALPQVRAEVADEGEPNDLAAEGAVCPDDERLAIGEWGDTRPVWEQMSEARSGLTGEFDRPDAGAVARAIRFHLYIGFGLEALELIDSFEPTTPDRPLWSSMARVLDDVTDPAPAFAGLLTCEGAAALWAFMATPAEAGQVANFPAVQRAFSALPAALRQEMGPRLIERLVAAGAENAVQVVANAIRRPGDTGNRAVALMDAGLAAEAGKFETADQLLRPLIEDPGPGTPEATIVLIESHAQRGLPLPQGTVDEIEAYASERAGGPEGERFQQALTLALALSGRPAEAFAAAGSVEAVQADLWRLLADLGTDDQILELATLAPGAAAPPAAAGQALRLSERFLNLGLPDQARSWLAGAPELDRILAARVAIAQRDGLSASAYLNGITGETADELRLDALLLTGAGPEAVAELKQAGRTGQADALLAQAGDWSTLGAEGQAPWQAAARALLAEDEAPPAGPLAEGAALADRAAQTREAVMALLSAIPGAGKSTP